MTNSDQNRISDDQHNNAPAVPQGEPVAWCWIPSQVFPDWIYSNDPTRVAEAKRFMGDGGVQPLYIAAPSKPAVPQGWPPFDELDDDLIDAACTAGSVLYRVDLMRAYECIRSALLAATPAPAPAQGEPFGYFRAEPFGWTDCSEDAEGAIALYEHPAKPAQEAGLTDDEIKQACTDIYLSDHPQGSESYDIALGRAIISALRAKGASDV